MVAPYRPYTPTERLGVNAVERLILQFGWIFREQHVADYGIDAEIEICDDGVPTGRLLKVQIKAGSSWFTEQTADGIVFRDSARHFEYWLSHSLPVVVTLYDPTSDRTWWEHIARSKVRRAGSGYKVVIPHNQLLTHLSPPDLRAVVRRPLTEAIDLGAPVPLDAARLLTTLRNARFTIEVASPRLNRALADVLLNLDPSIHIRLLLGQGAPDLLNLYHVLETQSGNFEVRELPALHLKQIVIDNTVALYGSSLNPDAFSANYELLLETTSNALVHSMAHAFARLWAESHPIEA